MVDHELIDQVEDRWFSIFDQAHAPMYVVYRLTPSTKEQHY